MTTEQIKAAHAETERLSRELDITNADHIALWLEANMSDASLGWLACRIVEAHEAATPRPQQPSNDVVEGGAVRELSEARTTLVILRTQIMVEIGRCADPSESRWEGVPEKLKERIDAIDAALAQTSAGDAEAMREACAKVADSWVASDYSEECNIMADSIAREIRNPPIPGAKGEG